MQGEQFGGERTQRFGRHAAAAEVSPRGSVTTDRSRGDDAAVFVAVRAGGVEYLVDQGGHAVTKFTGAEPAFDHGARRTGPDPCRICPCAAEKVQPGDHHRLAGTGFAGQDGQSTVEFGRRRTDRAQRLDADLGEHYCPRQPVTGSRNLRTSRSVNGALSRRTHLSGVPQRVTSSRPPAGTTISRRPSQNTSASWPVASTSTAMAASGLVTIGRAKSAWALLGTTRMASRSGQTIGPPAENAHAVEPVGVATSTPSHPKADTGRPSTSSTAPRTPRRGPFSRLASLRAQPRLTIRPSTRTTTSSVIRSSTR